MSTAFGKYVELAGAQAPVEGGSIKRYRVLIAHTRAYHITLDAASDNAATCEALSLCGEHPDRNNQFEPVSAGDSCEWCECVEVLP